MQDSFAYFDFRQRFAIIADENLGVPKNRIFTFFCVFLLHVVSIFEEIHEFYMPRSIMGSSGRDALGRRFTCVCPAGIR